MDTLLRDLRYAAKMLIKRPAVSAAAILCLGLGIGATTVMFSLVNGVLLRPLPYDNPEDIYVLGLHFPDDIVERSPVSPDELRDLREQIRSFEQVGGQMPWYFNLTDVDPPLRVLTSRLSANVLELLGVEPALGRVFSAEEEEQGAAVAVLSHGLWQRAFGGETDILGRRVSLSGVPYEVIGVMPGDFRPLARSTELWVPYVHNPRARRDMRMVYLFGRRASGVSAEQARAELDEIEGRFAADHPDLYPEGWGLRMAPLHETEVGDVRGRLLAFLGAVALVLLIACANVANLLLAQASVREKEVALRAAFGAGRGALVRQLLTESLTLAGLGALLGLGLAFLGLRVIVRLRLGAIPRLEEVAIDLRVLAFTLLTAILTAVLFGLAPALRASATRFQAALKEGGKTSASSRRHPLRSALVVIEIALAVVVLIGAGLMIRSFQRLQNVDPGFRPDDLVTMQINLPFPAYAAVPDRLRFYRELEDGLQAVPGVTGAGLVSYLPFTVHSLAGTILTDGQDPNDPGPSVGWRMVSPDYFETMKIPLIQGRVFSDLDHVDSEPRVVIIDAAMAKRVWPGENPIGKRLKMVGWFRDEWREVVGVVGQIKHHGLTDTAELLYLPYQQAALMQVGIAVRTAMDSTATAAAVREVTRTIDPVLPVAEVDTMERMISESLSGPRFNLVLFTLFGVVGLVLAAVGVYGVTSYSVAQRTGEIGIRRALGARRRDVLKLILGQGMVLAGLGLVLGLALAWLLTYLLSRLLADMVFGISATDLATFALVPVLLLAIALVANLLPARRAALLDPMVALREE